MIKPFPKSHLLPRVGRMEQLAAIDRYVIDDGKGRGMRAFEVNNASGLAFTVYPDRGLDIGPARFNGRPLTWMTRNGPVAPAFYDATGCEWLRTWMAGLVTTCGWLNVGNPCETPDGAHGIHGRMDHIPAEEVNTRCHWEGDDYRMEITGRIVHARVFGEHLVTERTIRTRLGSPVLELVDRTCNLGARPSPFMQLYHMNFGWPLISEKTRLVAPKHPVTPRDAEGAKGVKAWNSMPAPDADFAEQVLYHDLPADKAGFSSIKVVNPDFGATVILSFRKRELPYLVQWRQAGVGDYVMGLEPANCYPIGRTDFAKTGLLRTIAPNETIETVLRLRVN